MKSLFSFIFFLVFTFASVYGQYGRVSYHKKDGSETTVQSEAYFYRVITTDKESPNLFKYTEYYSKGDIKKTEGTLRDKDNFYATIGEKCSYYPNGQLYKRQHFDEAGKLIDTAETYYKNGILYTRLVYTPSNYNALIPINFDDFETNQPTEYILVQDSLGKKLVEKGTGYMIFMLLEHPELIREEGPLVGHLKHGEWKGTYYGNTFTENWHNGKLLAGVYTDSLGTIHPYTEETLIIPPKYSKGTNVFRKQISNNFYYTNEIKKSRVSGIVQVDFIVEKDGTTSNFKIRKDLGHGTGKEALIALKSVKKKWRPCYKRGIPTRLFVTVPLKINTSRR